jgi:hypothetical protein
MSASMACGLHLTAGKNCWQQPGFSVYLLHGMSTRSHFVLPLVIAESLWDWSIMYPMHSYIQTSRLMGLAW